MNELISSETDAFNLLCHLFLLTAKIFIPLFIAVFIVIFIYNTFDRAAKVKPSSFREILYETILKSLASSNQVKVAVGGLFVALPMGFTGIVAGFLTGFSRIPAVSALVPAILTFVGLVVVYMMDKTRASAIIAGCTVFLFTGNLLIGTVLGSDDRAKYDSFIAGASFRDSLADQEFLVRRHCVAIGLISDVSKPCLSASELQNSIKPENNQ
jgi:hypothetical protein